ncbi:TraB/GumN family protein [Methylobacterium nonmethylotrophicum]|uniref:TraB/GumN family protein n=1 Tax=Methylobacterium nonmethylotrophicum TaxID=1141884 RepID=A0A4Z0NQC7_9HYPH|nr:TraB/GumN family protein [Methylobacterium nonmethylotrophicum]TGD98931.1 TraB/GumN family protein [Methylobacterium nonmethylotrophicum]
MTAGTPARAGTWLTLLVLAVAATGRAEAACGGIDLFARLRERAPDAMAQIEAGRALPHAAGILFRLTRADREPSYLLGTLHLNDPRVVAFSPQVHQALSSVRQVALELAETPEAQRGRDAARVLSTFRAPVRHRASRLLKPADVARLTRLATERGFAPAAILRLRPAVLALMLDLPACARPSGDGGHGHAEQVLAERAAKAGVAVVGLETLSEQIAIMSRLSPSVERSLLLAVLRQAGAAEDIVETTIARYAARDTGALLAWMRSPALVPGDPSSRLPPVFLDRLLDARSARMRIRMEPLLTKGATLVAVGVAHLPGRAGLLRLLEQDGYAVERIE